MRNLIFQTIQTALLGIVDANDQPVIQHIDRFNNQLQYAEGEQPFRTPAVLIQFRDIEWKPLGKGVREAVVEVALHVVTDSRVGLWSDTMTVFSFLDVINARLHCLHAVDGKRTMDSLTIIASSTDDEFDELEDNVETYSCHVTDGSACEVPAASSRHIIFDVDAGLDHTATS